MDNLQVAADRMIKQSPFEALLKGLEIRKEAATWPELRPLYDLDHPQKTYPQQIYVKFWQLVRAQKFPDVPLEQADFELGKKLIYGYMNATTIGRLAFAMIPFMTPDNFFKIAPQLWDQGLGEYTAERISDKKVAGHFNQCILSPEALAGATMIVLEVTKAKNVAYEVAHLIHSGIYYNCDIIFQWE
jgi:uncharacterized protein (TIGR02265 family)